MARVGMRHLVFAPITQENAGAAPTYGTGVVLGRAVRGARTPNRYDAKLYGDDGIAESYNGLKDISIEVETTELEEDNAVTLGLFKAVGTGADKIYRQTGNPTVYGGCGWVETHVRRGVTLYIAYWIYKTQLGAGQEEARTKGENLEYGTQSLTGTGMPAFTDTDGDDAYTDTKVFQSLTEAITWLDNLANI